MLPNTLTIKTQKFTNLIRNKNVDTIIKRFSGKNTLPETLKKISDSASGKFINPTNTANTVTPKSPTEHLRNTRPTKDNPAENLETPQKELAVSSSSIDMKNLFHNGEGSTQEKITQLNIDPVTGTNINIHIFRDSNKKTTPEEEAKESSKNLANESSSSANEDTNFKYKAIYIDNSYHNMNSLGETEFKKGDPDHVYASLDASNDSSLILGRTTSSKGGTAEGKITNVKLSTTKYDGSYQPKPRIEKTGMTEENERLPNKQYPNPLNDDFGDTLPNPKRGGQYYQPYAEARIITKEEKDKIGIEENAEATEFLNQDGVKIILDEITRTTMGNDPSIMLSDESFQELLSQETNTNLADEIDDFQNET
jgi:hypothetical protein